MNIVGWLRSVLRRVPYLVRLKRYLRKRWVMRRLKGHRLMRRFSKLYPDAFFIQIGANDGEQLDHLQNSIYRGNWRGVMVEPVPYVFERLKKNYQHLSDRLALRKVAIAPHIGNMPFWHLKKAEQGAPVPRWYDALGSFRKEVVLKHVDFIPDIEERITSTLVPTLSFSRLCEEQGVEKVDLIQMDTEGYDYEVIKLIDFDRYRPKLLIYEHHHFDPDMQVACEEHLRRRGYCLYREVLDTWGIDMRVSDQVHGELLCDWQRLIPESKQLLPLEN